MPTDAPARTKTTYVILREVKDGDAVRYDPVQAGVEGNSAEHALRVWAEKAPASPTGAYVAIPSRSFKPTKVTFSQQTVVKVG